VPGTDDHAETVLKRVTTARLPTLFGQFDIHGYRSDVDGEEHVALVRGELAGDAAPLVRIHSECLTGEVFGSLRCDCREQLENALRRIAEEGRGVLVYLRGHEGRGIGLVNKLRAYALQDLGRDTVCANSDLGLPVDARDYGIAVEILRDLGVCRVRLMTNNPDKIHALEAAGVVVAERVPATSTPTPDNATYLLTKESKLGHLLGERRGGPVG
jgi:3,4-dihydroxy 2-butanone 4-phosphate synthase/GTP cyclohydrolase II